MAANNFLAGDQAGSGLGQTKPKDPNQVPPPGVNADVVYTDSSGKGYNTNDLGAAWGGGQSAFAQDPLNARAGDILKQQGYNGSTPQNPYQAPTPSAQPGGQVPSYTPPPRDPRSDDLFNLLMGRAKQSEVIDPNDPVLKAQTDAFNANNQRSQRSYLSQAAEKGGPNANLDAVGRSMAEKGAQAGGDFQATLMGNELKSRRDEIQQSLQEAGSLLTADQQLALQRELGTIDAALRQQQITSGNDQFTARLGLDTSNQANYWDAIRQGLL